MESLHPNLRILDNSKSTGLDLATELFHRINRIIPSDQKVLTVSPDCRARDAVALLRAHGYSQVPVVGNGEVLGVFSFRSFSLGTASVTLEEWQRQKIAPGDLPVDEYLEQFDFARVTDEMKRAFDAMDRDNGILIGSPERLIGILTPMDFLRYLYQVASPFVLMSEIELALRALIVRALTPDEIVSAARRTLSSAYGGEENVPTSLEDMSLGNYQSLISYAEYWKNFEPIFGGSRFRTTGKLKATGRDPFMTLRPARHRPFLGRRIYANAATPRPMKLTSRCFLFVSGAASLHEVLLPSCGTVATAQPSQRWQFSPGQDVTSIARVMTPATAG